MDNYFVGESSLQVSHLLRSAGRGNYDVVNPYFHEFLDCCDDVRGPAEQITTICCVDVPFEAEALGQCLLCSMCAVKGIVPRALEQAVAPGELARASAEINRRTDYS